ncbi:DUF6377 domain-containing protein [Pontibacter sp. E15-1]|uniref:DUF6377 domain-containing protein n=1 Tax=Pontibacter sp. E15-1 TaxID=2919918 RepID=UPI001F4FE141|nr:DUF6377 domain-containing protein [Pontibacter sp. E15-1]MCJ8164586.1 DUF6377 domain-containing protein [Pontibacter sp. E15-1]
MKLKGVFLTCLFLFLTHTLQAFASPQTDSLLHELTHTIENKHQYIQLKQQRIAKLQAALATDTLSLKTQYTLYDKLYREYRSFQYDEAFTYALQLQDIAARLQDPARITHAQLNLSFILLSAGLFKETFDALDEMRVASMPDSIRIDYYTQNARAYFDLASYNKDKHFTDQYMRKGGQYTDSAIVLSNKGEMQYYTLRGGKYEALGEYEEVKRQFQMVLRNFEPGYHQYAMAAHALGNAYDALGDQDKAIEMLARAAIADIKSSTTEAMALMRLAELLYNSGDQARAYYYIKQALEDARFYGARLRKMQVAAILPVIEGDRLATVESQRSRLFVYAVAISLLSLLVVVFAYVIFRQVKQLRKAKKSLTEANGSLQLANSKLKDINGVLQETNEALLEANKIKEEYIGYSFNMYTEYLDKIEKLKVAVDKRMRQKQYSEITKVMDSVSLKAERESLYQSFDRIFLKLFPNFVDVFNSYFKPEDRFELPDDQSLNVELRIFALIRIGISDHEQIARILEYSVRTVYNYKTKVKNRSLLSNEDFEHRIMEIKAI